MTEQREYVEIYTDGSFLFPNQKGYDDPDVHGAWAYVIKDGENLLKKSGMLNRMNGFRSSINRCEMWAIISGLNRINSQDLIRWNTIVVFSDSEYSVKTFRGDWMLKTHTKNRDLIKLCSGLVDQLKAKGMNVVFKWIPGHSGNPMNELADQLAGERMKEHYGKAS